MRARVQTIFKMIQHCSAQQLTYLLRTCPTHVTPHAARRLDAAIANTIHHIMDCVLLLPPHDSIAMRAVLNRFFLPSDWEEMASLTPKLRVRLPMLHP